MDRPGVEGQQSLGLADGVRVGKVDAPDGAAGILSNPQRVVAPRWDLVQTLAVRVEDGKERGRDGWGGSGKGKKGVVGVRNGRP